MFRDENGKVIDVVSVEHQEQRIAQQYVKPDDVVLELGARYGTVSAKIQTRLANKKLHVAVEPDSGVIPALRMNLHENGCETLVFQGIVSKVSGVVEPSGYATIVRLGGSEDSCAIASVDELETKIGAKFTVLIADCEGCIGPFLQDFPQLLDQLRLIHFETDPGYDQTDYEHVKSMLVQHGFQEVEHVNWQWVYVRAASHA
jgi:FkbM family methyltransferase